jgi:fatty-acyl-CoA synthase
VFLRILPGIQVTGTFKYRKLDLVTDGFDPAKVSDPLYVRGEDGYEPLTPELEARVLSGEIRV